MIIVRKGKTGELDKIIKVANSAFESVRFKGFDFRQVMPKVYDTDIDTSEMHFVAEDVVSKEIIAVAGNLINELNIDGKSYKYSILGSVSTIPQEQKKGYMKKIIEAVDQECKDEELVFSMLVGDRKRYNYFNYEICGFRYEYVFSSKRYQDYYSADVRVSSYKEEDLDGVYSAYQKTQALNLRDKEHFFISFKDPRKRLYTIRYKENIVGYFCTKADKILEFSLTDLNILSLVITAICRKLGYEKISFIISPLNKETIFAFDKIAEDKICNDKINVKVYNIKKFLEMLVTINLKVRNIKDVTDVIRIDGVTYRIDTTGGKVSVEETNDKVKKNYTMQEFLRTGLGLNYFYDNNSRLFPLLIDFKDADLF